MMYKLNALLVQPSLFYAWPVLAVPLGKFTIVAHTSKAVAILAETDICLSLMEVSLGGSKKLS